MHEGNLQHMDQLHPVCVCVCVSVCVCVCGRGGGEGGENIGFTSMVNHRYCAVVL